MYLQIHVGPPIIFFYVVALSFSLSLSYSLSFSEPWGLRGAHPIP